MKHRTRKVNAAAGLIYQISSALFNKKKTESEPKRELNPVMYPAPESNRHGFPQVFETSASTNSRQLGIAFLTGCKCI